MPMAKESPYFTAGFGLMVRMPEFGCIYVSSSSGSIYSSLRRESRECEFETAIFTEVFG